jgi:archaemetzincin
MAAIYLWWIGADAADRDLLEQVRRQVGRTFEAPAVLWDDPARPTGTYDTRRGQHSSTQILRWLAANQPPGAMKTLAITDVDLFIPVLTFVYGEAQLGGRAAVVSMARLGDGTARISPAMVGARLVKEAVHELGHTFGLTHCRGERCVMTRSVNMAGVDRKAAVLCTDCRTVYRDRLLEGLDQ